MSGFSNPIVNAAGTLIKNVIKSVNYVAGSLGWQISKDGNAEFNLGNFRGSITVTGSNGSKIVIDAGAGYPTMFFYSKDGTNYSQLSLINANAVNQADMWISSGQWTPPDAVPRAVRLYMAGSTSNQARLSVDRVSDGAIFGGIVRVFNDLASMGYYNLATAALQNEIVFDANDINLITSRDIQLRPGRNVTANIATGRFVINSNAGDGLFVDGKRITANVQADNIINMFAGTLNTGGPAIMPGVLNWTRFEKKYTASRLIATIAGTFYSSGSGSGASFGLNIGGVSNTYLAKVEVSNPSLLNHTAFAGVGQLSGTLPAGFYDISPIWGRTSGTGTLNVDGNDCLSWSVTEVG